MTPEQFWRSSAQSVAFRVNLGWWLKYFTPWLLSAGVLAMAGILIARRNRWDESWSWWGFFALLLIGGAVAFFFSRSRWFSARDALVRLDSVQGLNNRLSAASAGVGPWPAASSAQATDPMLRWDLRESLLPSVAVLALLLGASQIPIPDALRPSDAGKIEKPTAMKQVEDWVEKLKAAEELDQEKVEALARQLNELSKKNPQDWYSQANLEAADSMREQTALAARSLQRDAEMADQVAEALSTQGAQMDPEMAKELSKQLGDALQNMAAGKLGMSKEMMEQLKNMDPNKLGRQLNQQQLQQIRDNLKKGLQACKNCAGLPEFKEGPGEEGPGKGGITRGPGTAPLSLSEHESQLATQKVETISNDDMSRATTGDMIALTNAKPKADGEGFTTGVSGQEAAEPGKGGEAVWRDNLMPEERESLRAYFK